MNTFWELRRFYARMAPLFLLPFAVVLWSGGNRIVALVFGSIGLVGLAFGFRALWRPRLSPEQALSKYPDADRATAIHSPDGTVTFACPKGFYLGPIGRYVPVEGSIQVEAISYDEDHHRLKFQLRVVEMSGQGFLGKTEGDATEARYVSLPPELSPDDAMKQAINWEKRRFKLRNGEIQSLTAA